MGFSIDPENKMAGVYLPQPTMDRIKLIALSKSANQSELFRDWIIEKVKSYDSNRDLIQDIGEQILESWEKTCLNSRVQLTFAQYLGRVRQELERKKLNLNHIENILKKVSELRHGRNDASQSQRSGQRT